MNEREKRPEVGKSESPEDVKKSEVGGPKSGEEENDSAIDIPNSEIILAPSKSPPVGETFENPTLKNKSEIVNRKSEINEPPTANSKLQTEAMEVHHHPEVEKKGLKEYILEGLMIFLAVMMGFFAESLREHIADGDHEKQSIESLVKAVASDTVQLHDVILQATGSIKAINSLMGLKNLDLGQAGNKQKFYLFSLAGFSNDTYFRSNDGALQQLNSSGMLRLISDRATVDSIFKYELLNKTIAAQEADDYFVFKEMLTTMAKVQDLSFFQDTSAVRKQLAGATGVQYTIMSNKLPAISNDKVLMQAYFNYASLYMATKSSYNYMLENQLGFSRRLIIYLKTAYDLK
jgi:hypothetical protein